MKYKFVIAMAAAVLCGAFQLYAVEAQYQTGKIVNIEQKSHSRILYYVVDTPITKEDPYYEISVRINSTTYVGDYTPRHSGDTLPAELKSGADVKTRLEKHFLYVQISDGSEMQLVIVKHIVADSAAKAPEPVPPKD